MNLLHFKYAVEVARTRSISRAAENLFMGQPNLSRAIKELEADLGITIFKRTSKGITVTADGEQFLRYARRILDQVDEIEELYKKGAGAKQRLSVCVPRASYIAKAMVEFSKSIKTDMPAEISYRETNSSRTINSLLGGECDLGIIRYQVKYEKYFQSLKTVKEALAEKEQDLQKMYDKVRCTECGAEMSSSDDYCPKCGTAAAFDAELKEEKIIDFKDDDNHFGDSDIAREE